MLGLNNLKSFVKNSITKIMAAQTSKIEYEVSQAEIISFDIFDTLIKRNVIAPQSVHDIVHDEFLKQTGIDIPGYSEVRIAAEREARKCSQKEEISLKNIFDYMNEISENNKILLRELEEKIELEVCCPDLRMKAIYEKVLKDGKHVIITSDMYLEEQTIKKILNKCGYNNYEKLYLSSHFGLCKATGSLFEVIKRDYAAYPRKKILHIGDNLKGDYIMPKKRGIDALLIDGQRNLLRFWKKNNKGVENQFLYQRFYSFLNNHISDTSDTISIAYEVLGPMLLGYCTWLNENIKKDNIEKIFFLNREGKILQAAFNTLYPQNNIPQKYLYVSRQALVIPLLADANNFDEMIEILKIFLHVPVLKTICISCGLDQNKFNNELAYIGLNLETKIYEIPDNKKESVYRIVQKVGGYRFKQQKEYVLEYLKENDFKEKIAIADIGWLGTMQIALQKYMSGVDIILYGYYLGVRNMEIDDYYANICRKGYLFEPGRNNDFELMARFTTEIFELLFLNQTGSVQEYVLKNNKVVPVLAKPEHVGVEGEFVESVQDAVLEFLVAVRKDGIWKENMGVPIDIIMNVYSRFAVYPSMMTIRIFESFQGYNGGNLKKLLPEHNFLYYMMHFTELRKDFDECHCKIFFMKKLFKINFPYYVLLKLLVTKFNFKSEYRKRYYNNKGK